ncbi:DUF1987 domain-containing protein [Ekhidna sp.]|uniref:DUF1987 domain-containing protein n=1 Tax=Ekhidna sp. TaxID=2608089 RepID=UPI0032F06192
MKKEPQFAFYCIEATEVTPRVYFNLTRGVFEIKGRSYPSNSLSFYKRILDHLTLLQDSGIKLDLSVRIILEYFNTSSSKCLHNLVRKLNEFIEKGHRVQINWYYPYEDEDMKELVEDMNGLFGNKMKVIRAMTH